MLDQIAIVSPALAKPLPQLDTGMKLIELPQAVCRLESDTADALNNTPTPPCGNAPDAMFASVKSAPSSSCSTCRCCEKLIGDPVLFKTSTHSQSDSGESGSYMISVIRRPAGATPPGTTPGLAWSAVLLIAG